MRRRAGRNREDEFLDYLRGLLAKGEMTPENVELLASAGGVRAPVGKVRLSVGVTQKPFGKPQDAAEKTRGASSPEPE